MANIHEVGSMQAPESNGHPEIERLSTLVSSLQQECERLRHALTKAEAERDLYLKAVYENARSSLHFEDLDIHELQRNSAGPIRALE